MRNAKSVHVLCSVLFICAAGLHGQELQPTFSQERPLTLLEARDVPGVFANPVYPAKCGMDGSIYVRFFTGTSEIPATRISGDGTTVQTFRLDGTRYSGHAKIWDFAPTPHGGVFELIYYRSRNADEGYRLLGFGRDGKIKSDIALNATFDPMQIAVFGDGHLLIAGRTRTELGLATGVPKMAVFDDRGQLVTTLILQHDVQAPKKRQTSAKGKSQDEPDAAEIDYNIAFAGGVAQAADDGNAYVLRRAPAGPLFAITPSGKVRAIPLPKRDGALINSAMVARGRVAVHYLATVDSYHHSDVGLYSVFELDTMERFADYKLEESSPMRNTVPVCYDVNQFTFLRVVSKGRASLLVAKAQ